MKTRDQHGGRSGVALILVIGLLALMMVMGVTFSIYMRTGRVAAGNFLSDVRARNLLHVALNRAMNGVDTWVGDNLYPTNDAMMSGTSGGYVDVAVTPASFAHLPLGALAPQGASIERRGFLVTTSVPSRIGAGTVINLTKKTFGTITQIVDRAGSPGIVEVRHTTLQGGSSTLWDIGDEYRFLQPGWTDLPAGTDEGRVGYVVVNASGLLDANYAGGRARGIGTNANEIQIAQLPEVGNAGNAANLVAARPYETIQELTVVGSNTFLLSRPANFVTYSAAFPGDSSGFAPVDISGGETALAARFAAITNALVRSGIDADQAAFVFTNLLDYVDADSVPHDLASPCTESVPMINELVATNAFLFRTNGTFMLNSRVSVEWFYPFVRASGDSFWISYTASVECVSAPGFPVPAVTNGAVDAAYPANSGVFCFGALSFNLGRVTGDYTAFQGQSIQLRTRVTVQVRLNGANGVPVDAAPASGTIDITMPAITVPALAAVPAAGLTLGASSSSECWDPRFNWDGSAGGRQWRAPAAGAGISLGSMNSWATTMLATRDTDGHASMYVADRPLVSVTELAYLLRGRNPGANASPLHHFNTIRLFDRTGPQAAGSPFSPLDRILDSFVLGNPSVAKGAVNINTGNREVMLALLMAMPVDRYPGDNSGGALTLAQADDLAGYWVSATSNIWAGRFSGLSDIGHVTNVLNMAPYAGATPFQQESFIRNISGLATIRQHLFTILLYAQTTKVVPMMPDRSVVAGLRGIAEVWRDPVVSTNGFRTQSIRYLSVLSE
jgi:hypothetical protein